MKIDKFSQITFNPDKLKAQRKLDKLKRKYLLNQIFNGVLATVFFACLLACFWLGLLLFA